MVVVSAVPADEWAEEEQEAAEPAPELLYPSLDQWMAGYLAPTWRRNFGNGSHATWCPGWWRHAEAVDRLTALWRAWEHLRLDPATGMAVWWRDFADPAMAVLTDTRGPFANCSPDRGHGLLPGGLPLEEPPPGLFGG